MNIHVMSDNYYLFYGISHFLNNFTKNNVIKVTDIQVSYLIKLNQLTTDDIFIMCCDGVKFDFSLLLDLDRTSARVIVINNNKLWNLHKLFDFNYLPDKFFIDELIISFYKSHSPATIMVGSDLKMVEKKILVSFLQKTDGINDLDYLHLSPKRLSYYKRNIVKKLGLRNILQLYMLPSIILEYL